MSVSLREKPVELVVFDFDGTSISGNSPVLLVYHLWHHRLLRKSIVTRIALWALAYKLRLPQNESWVRGLVFSAFEGTQKEEADRFLGEFYREKIAHRFRREADEEIARHRKAGREVWAVSATFEPIISEAMKEHAYTHQFSTRMMTDDEGAYTRKVDGLPVEGAEKLRVLREYADATYGAGNWVLTHAYGDHHSDRELLSAAEHPCAVTPDRPLRRFAKRKGWPILEWD